MVLLDKLNAQNGRWITLFFVGIFLVGCFGQSTSPVTEVNGEPYNVILVDSVWAGHPVGFCLYTFAEDQYVTYYNAQRNLVLGKRNLTDSVFQLFVFPPTDRKTHFGTSTVLEWDSHNSTTLAVDRKGYIHLAANMHNHPITYFRSERPGDIYSMKQYYSMVGTNEKRVTYPHFNKTKTGELIFHYRTGGSGNGNEIYNQYNEDTQTWNRLLDTSLTDGQGLANAYQTSPIIGPDGYYHIYWVWRDSPDCSTNHDLSYIKSPDLIHWYTVGGEAIELPVTMGHKNVIVDPIPVKGGIINLAAKLNWDKNHQPMMVYHKYDEKGDLQFYGAKWMGDEWKIKQITDWDYRWEFKGNGSISNEVILKSFLTVKNGFEINYYHIKYGNGRLTVNDDFELIEEERNLPNKVEIYSLESDFPGMEIRSRKDEGQSPNNGIKYQLKWETLPANRDRKIPKPWPNPSNLYVFELNTKVDE